MIYLVQKKNLTYKFIISNIKKKDKIVQVNHKIVPFLKKNIYEK
jgi:hypothetical protein